MSMPMYVVMPSHDRPELAIRALRSLLTCVFPASYRGTIVVENGSRSEALEQFVTEHCTDYRISYRFTPDANKSAALNAVVRDLPDNGLIVFFDDDVIIHPYALRAYSVAAASYPAGSHFGGVVMPDYPDNPPATWLKNYLPMSVVGWSLGSEQKVVHHETFFGCNWAARQACLVGAGLFDSTMGPGRSTAGSGEETAIQLTMRQQAAGVYVPDAIVWHYVPAERCSQEWAIARAYAQSKGHAYRIIKESPSIIHKDILESAFLTVLTAVMLRLLTPFVSKRTVFRLEHCRSAARGFLSGSRLAIAEAKKRRQRNVT